MFKVYKLPQGVVIKIKKRLKNIEHSYDQCLDDLWLLRTKAETNIKACIKHWKPNKYWKPMLIETSKLLKKFKKKAPTKLQGSLLQQTSESFQNHYERSTKIPTYQAILRTNKSFNILNVIIKRMIKQLQWKHQRITNLWRQDATKVLVNKGGSITS